MGPPCSAGVPSPRRVEEHASGMAGRGSSRKQDGHNQAGKAGAGAEVDPGVKARWGQGQELGAVGEMAVPDGIERAGGHQIDGLLPLAQQFLVDGEALNCFT